MPVSFPLMDTGRNRRMARLTGIDERSFLVPLDHSVGTGPIATTDRLDAVLGALAVCGADGVIVHKGRARFVAPVVNRSVGLVVHLNGSTMHAPDADDKVLLADVEEAIRIGADGVSVHVNVGSISEASQLTDLGNVAGACARWGLPLIAMVYPRGPKIENPCDPDLVAHAANLAADLGADIVKLPYTGDVSSMADVVASCPIPIIVAGGVSVDADEELFSLIRDVMSSGVNGVAIGRNVFQAADVTGTVSRIAEIVHPRALRTPFPRAIARRDQVAAGI
jgi:2-amino-4,5-dihydroxy-6-oxo-7-(phosphooxy)heptanoate synthase